MRYVALLRAVNVGGTGKVNMKELIGVFESAGMLGPKSYINSGNVVFECPAGDRAPSRETLTALLEAAIERHFGFNVQVLIKSRDEIGSIVAALPEDWVNDDTYKCDVFFLWPELDSPSILDTVAYDTAVDDVRYTPGAFGRHTARTVAAKSKLVKLVGTPLYKQMTVRNCNTVRKLLQLLDE